MSSRREFLIGTAGAVVASAVSAQAPHVALGEAARPMTSASVPRATSRKKTTGPLRLALVGTGQITSRYLQQAKGSERVRFVATCARTLDSAKARAVEYGIGAWFDDYQRMYDAVEPDGVVIATPHALHAEHSIAALDRGIHVLCEKPMATRLEDCHAMVEAAQRNGAVLLCLPFDATAPFRDTLPYLNVTTLGVFTGADAQIILPGPARDQKDWSNDPKLAGGGVMLGELGYPVSRLISLLGPAKRVAGFVNTLIPHRIIGPASDSPIDLVPPPRDPQRGRVIESVLDDNATLMIEWPGGQYAVVRGLRGTSTLRINDIVIYGRHGTLWMQGFLGNDVIIHSPEKAIPGAEAINWYGNQNCYRIPVQQLTDLKDEGLVAHFADCIEGRSVPTCGGAQQLHVHEILFKGYESARTGRAQELTTTYTSWHPIDPAFHDTRSRPV